MATKTPPNDDDIFDDIDEEDQKYSKPSYDGRLSYYKTLEKYMLHIAEVSCVGDYQSWARSIAGFIGMITPYIKPADGKDLKRQLNDIRKLNFQIVKTTDSNNATYLEGVLDTKLQDLTDAIYQYGKHIFLPVGGEDEEEFDVQKFLKESDL